MFAEECEVQRMSKTPIKLKLPVRKPGSLPLAEQRRRFLEAACETGRSYHKADFDAVSRWTTQLKVTPEPVPHRPWWRRLAG